MLAKVNLDPARPRSGFQSAIAGAGSVQGAVDVIDAAEAALVERKGKLGRKATKGDLERYEGWRRIAAAHYGEQDAGEAWVSSGPPMSAFALGARDLDSGRKTPYWATHHEMAARAFQAWAEDRLAGQGRRNDYLSAKADNKYYIDPLFGPLKPFPEGAERERINQAFDRLFETMRAEKTMEKALRGSPRVLFVKARGWFSPDHGGTHRKQSELEVARLSRRQNERKNKGPLQKGGPFSAFPKLQAPYGCGITPLGVTSAAPGSGRTSPGDPEGCLSSIHHRVVFFKALSRRRRKPRHCEDADALVEEHERLIDVLRSPEHVDDLKEAKIQRRELEAYRRAS